MSDVAEAKTGVQKVDGRRPTKVRAKDKEVSVGNLVDLLGVGERVGRVGFGVT